MLHYRKGDLLESDCTVIIHQANCFKTMGPVIAALIAKKFPEAEQADKNSTYAPEYKYGKFTSANSKGKTIVNLYSQFGLGSPKHEKERLEREGKFKESLDNFFYYAKSMENINLSKVGVPYKIGCNVAGGDWEAYERILKHVSEFHGVDIYIYQLD